MKNRVLAWCLTVALLLGMMPAITLPTRVYAADADLNVDAVFTQETITVDGNLSETSWKNATYYDVTVGGVTGKLAVVIKSGNVYVALKANATSVSAAIGGKSTAGTTVSGVTELCVPDVTIGSFGAVLNMTLTVDGTAITVAATCTQKEINLNPGAGTLSDKLLTPGTGDIIAANSGHKDTVDGLDSGNALTPAGTDYYWYPRTSLPNNTLTAWGRFDNGNGSISLDHSKNMEVMFQLQYNQFYEIGDAKKIYTTASGSKGVSGVWYFMLNDSDAENGGFVYSFLYKDGGKDYIQFLMPTGTYGNDVYSDPIDLGSISARFRVKLVWRVDGAVEVYVANSKLVTSPAVEFIFGDFEHRGTIENATWTRNTTAASGNIDNPCSIGAIGGATVDGSAVDFFESGLAYGGSASAYIWDTQITQKEPLAAIEDGDYLGEVTVPDVVTGNLPEFVTHAYLGNLPLTWSADVPNIVAADGVVTHGLEDQTVTVTAKVGDTVVVDAKSVIIKGVEKVASLYTAEAMTADNALTEASWKFATWYAFAGKGITGSVAVVVNQGKAYVAIKSAATSGTVTLAGKEVNLTFNGGVAEVAIPNLGLTQYDNNLLLQITLSDGSNTLKASCVAAFTNQAANLDGANGVKQADLIGNSLTANGVSYGDKVSLVTGQNTTVYPGCYGTSLTLNPNETYPRSTWIKRDLAPEGGANTITLDHTQQIVLESHIQFNRFWEIGDHSKFGVDEQGDPIINGRYWLFSMNDSDPVTGGFVYPFLYRENDKLWLQCLMPGSTPGNNVYSEPIDLGAPLDSSGKFFKYNYKLKLVWNVDGSLAVYFAGSSFQTSPVVTFIFNEYELKGTIQGATWTRNTNGYAIENANTISPWYDGSVYDYVQTHFAASKDASDDAYDGGYIYFLDLFQIPAGAEIDFASGLGTVDVPNVVTGNLPKFVAHSYLGNLPLTWGDGGAGIVAADGTVTPKLDDTRVTLTAMWGDTSVLTKEVTIKGIDKVASVFTAETMTADKALTETSWKRSAWYMFAGESLNGEVAVVINKGVAYVAVKSANATSGTVTLAGKEAALTFANGVAEVAIADLGLTKYENNLLLQITLSDGVNELESSCVAVFTAAAAKMDVSADAGTTVQPLLGSAATWNLNSGSAGNWETDNLRRYITITGAGQYVNWGLSDRTDRGGAALEIDHSKQVVLNFGITMYHDAFYNAVGDAELVTIDADQNLSLRNGYLIRVNDGSTNGGFFYVVIYADNSAGAEHARVKARLVMPGSTAGNVIYSEAIDLGQGTGALAALAILQPITFTWDTDGSVNITAYESFGVKQSPAVRVEGATWTRDTNAPVGSISNPVSIDKYSDKTTTGDFFDLEIRITDPVSDSISVGSYLWQPTITHKGLSAPVTFSEGFASNLIPDEISDDLPGFVEHAYLGNLSLTWSDNGAGYVSESGAILLPEVDTVVTLTAYAGSTEVLKKEVTIKAAEKLGALATGETMTADGKLHEVSWRYAAWKEISGNVPGSVAVLMKGGEAYVAIQSATATTATVTLGSNTVENIVFNNGVAEIKIEDASIDTIQETLAVAVTLSNGVNSAKLKCNKVVLDKQKVNSALAGDGFFIDTSKASDNGGDGVYQNGKHFVSSGGNFMNGSRRVDKGTFFAITSGAGGAKWSHNNDIYIESYLWANNMSVSAGGFDPETGSAEGYNFHFLDRESNAIIFVNIYKADEEGSMMACVMKSDKSSSDPIDLGIKLNENSSAARIGVLWGKDNSVTVLADGVVKGVVENATVAATSGWTSPDSADRVLTKATTGHMYVYEYAVREITDFAKSVLTQQVALGDNIGFIFKGSDISATVGENTYTGSNVTVDLAAAQMNDVVNVTVNDNSGLTYTQNYTVRDYALSVLASQEHAAYHDMVKAMLHYGAAAQKHFGYDAENPVNANIGDLGDVTVPGKLTVGKDGTCPEGIAYYGTSLIFRNKITIRFYFELTGDLGIEAYTFTDKDGKPMTAIRDGQTNRYYMDINGINPQQYDDTYTVSVDGAYTVSYSCLHYITRMYHNNVGNAEKEGLVNLLKAMYAYHTAAVTLLGNNGQ